MTNLLQHATLVVTGGFGVLGRAVAELALSEGARVALVDVAPEPADLPASLRAPGIVSCPMVDLQDPGQAARIVARLAEDFGRIDALANIAGGFLWETLADGDIAGWDRMFNQNLRTAVNMSRAVMPRMTGQGSGAIVNVGANGAVKAAAGMGAYAASKSAVHRLTEALAEEVKSAGIRVNAVLPSILDTPANRVAMPDAEHANWVAPIDLARVIVFLCSADANAVTGALLPVTGRV